MQVVVAERAHADSAVRLERDETERGEAPQRLTHRRSGDTEPLRELLLPEHRARLELARDDRLLDQAGDVVGLRALKAHVSRAYASVVRKSFSGTLSATFAKTSFASSEASTACDLLAHALLFETARLHPGPDLGARDLGGRGVLHQVVDRGGADALQPRVDVAHADADVHAQTLVGDRRAGNLEVDQLLFGDLHVVPLALDLVRALAEHRVELRDRRRHQVGVRDPRAVEAVAGLAALVLRDLRERNRVHLRVSPRRDERRHPADRVSFAVVARLHEQLGVRAHERHRHRHLRAVRQHRTHLLDAAEDVVPAPGVQRSTSGGAARRGSRPSRRPQGSSRSARCT